MDAQIAELKEEVRVAKEEVRGLKKLVAQQEKHMTTMREDHQAILENITGQ